MKKLITVPVYAIALAALCAGCLNVFTGATPVAMGNREITNYAADGATITSIVKEPVYGYRWHNIVARIAYDTHADSAEATYGDVRFVLNGYNSNIGTNVAPIVSATGTAVGNVIGAAASATAK